MSQRKFVPYNASLTDYARENRKHPTKTEKVFRDVVLRKKWFLGYKFRRQKIVGYFILDFYCSELLLGIELDWWYHKKVEDYDVARDSFIYKKWIEVVRFTNNDIEHNLVWVIDELTAYVRSRELHVKQLLTKKRFTENSADMD